MLRGSRRKKASLAAGILKKLGGKFKEGGSNVRWARGHAADREGMVGEYLDSDQGLLLWGQW